MTEITQADRDAYDVWTAAFRAWNDNPEIVKSCEDAAAIIQSAMDVARMEERAAIVAWLRNSNMWILETVYWADGIEAKEHLK